MSAHETTRKVVVPVQIRQVQSPSGPYQVAFGCLPRDAVSGELVVCEIKLVPPKSGAAVTFQVLDAGRRVTLPLHQEDSAGVYGVEYRFPRAGTYPAEVRVGQDPPAAVSIDISAGLVERLRWTSLIVLPLFCSAWGIRKIWRSPGPTEWTSPHLLVRIGTYAAATVALVAVVDRFAVPEVGRALLPLRSDGAVDWGTLDEGPREIAESPLAPRVPDLAAKASFAEPAAAGDIELTGRVVARPGAVADVFVPMAGRVVFTAQFVPRVGVTVEAGQTLAMLERRYVMDESVHLINERWPILRAMLAAKRRMLETNIALEKSRYLYKRDSVALKMLQDDEAAAAIAATEYQRWRDNLTKQDAQITERELVTRPITAPIAGTIASANFTQGQLVYEGDKLFTIADVSTVWVRLDVPERLADRVGSSVDRMLCSTPSLHGETFTGSFVMASRVVDQATRTVPFFFEVSNRAKRLKVGMSVSAQIDSRDRSQAVQAAVPNTPRSPAAGSTRTPRADAQPGSEVVHATGIIEADPQLQAQVVAPMWGRIEFARRRLAVGDHVAKGEEIARLVLELSAVERYPMETRRAEIAAELEQAKKRKAAAELDFRRAVALFRSYRDEPFIKQQVEWTETLSRNASEEEATIAGQVTAFAAVIARRDPKITMVTAPIAGTITEIAFAPGELDQTQQFRRLFTITDLSRVWVAADVFEKDIDAIRGPRFASFTPAGGASRPLGAPLAIADSLDEKTRTLRVVFQVPNPSGSLRLGTFTTLAFDVQ